MHIKIVGILVVMLLITSGLTFLCNGLEAPRYDRENQTEGNTISFAISPSTPYGIYDLNDPIEIYEGEKFQTWITVYWDPPDPQKQICLWVNTNTFPEGARLIPGCNCDNGEVSSLFDWTPSTGQAGTYYIEFEVGEECWEKLSSFIFTIIVKPAPIPGAIIGKWVSIDDGETWTKEESVPVCTLVRFRIVVYNSGSMDLINIHVTDTLPSHLEYMANADPFEPVISGDDLLWVFSGPLHANETRIIEFDAHVREAGNDENEARVTADSLSGSVSDYDTVVITGIEIGHTISVAIHPITGLGITALITNDGEEELDSDLECRVTVRNRFLLRGNESVITLEEPLGPGDTVEVHTRKVFGIGFCEITVWVFVDDVLIGVDTREGFLGGSFVFYDDPFPPYRVGADWITDYSGVQHLAKPGHYITNLYYAGPDAKRFHDVIVNEPTWESGFLLGDLATSVAYHRKEGDSIFLLDGYGVDLVDIMYHAGHGCGYTTLGWGDCYIFGKQDSWDDWYIEATPHRKMAEWGDNDLEWIILDVCSALALKDDNIYVNNYLYDRWMNQDVMHGIHYILGFRTPAYEDQFRGELYANYLTGKTLAGIHNIRTAWQMATQDTETTYDCRPTFDVFGITKGAYVRAAYWELETDPENFRDTANDHLHGFGSVAPPIELNDDLFYVYSSWPCAP